MWYHQFTWQTSNPFCQSSAWSTKNFNDSFRRLTRDLVSFAEATASFECTCPQPCSAKRLVLLSSQTTPATKDLTPLTAQTELMSADECRNDAPSRAWAMDASKYMRVLILQQESRRGQSVSYTKLMALADVYNMIGLFFGVSVLSMYGALESAIIASSRPGGEKGAIFSYFTVGI